MDRTLKNACLVAVVEVDKAQRVVCQAANCGHGVYRRIHVVRHEGGGGFGVYGSDCFQRLFAGVCSATPSYGGAGRMLTPEERHMLINNTKNLIAQFEEEHRMMMERMRTTVRDFQTKALLAAKPPDPVPAPRNSMVAVSSVVSQARENLRRRHGIDPDLPAWKGLLTAEIEKLSR